MAALKHIVSVVPNGLFRTGADQIGLKFSMVLGIAQESDKDIVSLNTTELTSTFRSLFSELKQKKTLALEFDQVKLGAVDLSAMKAADSLMAKWEQLLSGHDFILRKNHPLDPVFDRKMSDFYEEDIYRPATDGLALHPLKAIDLSVGSSKLDTKTKRIEYFDRNNTVYRERVLRAEKRYDLIDYSGKLTNKKIKDKQSNPAPNPPMDLRDVVHHLLQHPSKAREYGLITDFVIQISESDAQAMALYFPHSGAATEAVPTREGILQLSGLEADKYEPDPTTVMTAYLKDQSRYYHGLPDFGLLSLNDYEFSYIDRDKQLHNESNASAAIRKNLTDGKRFLEEREVISSHIQGIFLHHLKATHSLQKLNSLGINISVQKSRSGEVPWVSLCKRAVIYTPADGKPEAPVIEQGWIQPEPFVEAGDKHIGPQSVFQWKGLNLCLAPLKPKRDQQAEQRKDVKQGGFVGINENGELEHFAKKSFTFEYQGVEDSDLFLERGYHYKFMGVYVQSNGWALSTNAVPSNPAEITYYDLAKIGKYSSRNYQFNSGEFSMETEPVGSLEFPKPKNDAGTSANGQRLVMYEDKAVSKEVFPPAISFQQGMFLSLYNKSVLQATDKNYFSKVMPLMRRNASPMPASESETRISYLADIRAKQLLVTAGNWYTAQFFKTASGTASFFDFQTEGDFYRSVKPGKITLTSDKKVVVAIEQALGLLKIRTGQGYRFKFNLQVGEDVSNKSSLADKLKLTSVNSLLLTEKLPGSGKVPLEVLSPVAAPDPLVTDRSEYNAIRPVSGELKDHVFFSFFLHHVRLRLIKRLQLVASYTILEDDGENIPDKTILDREAKAWKSANPNGALLNGEYPPSVFYNEHKNLVHPQVYRNRFGFDFKLEESMLHGLTQGDVLFEYKFTPKSSLKVVYESGKTAHLYFQKAAAFKTDLSLDIDNVIRVTYVMDKVLRMELTVGTATYTQFELELPHQDLSPVHLEVMGKIEQLLISGQSGKSYIRTYEPDDKAEFFAFYQEKEQVGFAKKIRVEAVGSFQDIYTDLDLNKQMSTSGILTLNIPGNVIPEVPRFTLHTVLGKDQTDTSRTRSSQLYLEIDRPMKHGDQLAIILSVITRDASGNFTSALGPKTSAVGRDISTMESNIQVDLNGRAVTLKDMLTRSSIKKSYLNKYINDSLTGDILVKGELDPETFEILKVQPFFDAGSNKWIAVLDLSDSEKIAGHYNPFVKIVAARFRSRSMGNTGLSKLSPARFINLYSRRKISFSRENRAISEDGQKMMTQLIKINIDNFAVGKKHKSGRSMTSFIVCARNKTVSGILGTIVPLRELQNGNLKQEHHFIRVNDQSGFVEFKAKTNIMVSVYEYESFENSLPADQVTDWIDESTMRLIYIEELDF
ncbi:hypothetical protein [Pedobacter sp. JY14-1]|uniref:hypothetical protein n=1 Tax=Pedobacter sp. JY14-1 TaxID=3034151 RepID=UPI0023E2AF87|nr:hypothetical protein [Pedobacter sp. JY14-1]